MPKCSQRAPRPLGYKLTSVDLGIRNAADCPHTVSVYRANSIFHPSGLEASLSRGVTGGNEANYTASGDGIDLDPSTRYSIVVDSTTDCRDASVYTTEPDDVDEAAPGWTIRSQGHQRAWDETRTNDWDTTPSDNALRITINGHVIVANTAPTASAGAVTTLEDTGYSLQGRRLQFLRHGRRHARGRQHRHTAVEGHARAQRHRRHRRGPDQQDRP